MMRQPTAYKPVDIPNQVQAKEEDAVVPDEAEVKPSIGQQVKDNFDQFENNFDAVLQEINRGSVKSERSRSMMNVKGSKV